MRVYYHLIKINNNNKIDDILCNIFWESDCV